MTLLLSDYADLMPLLHPDYPTNVRQVDSLYEDHMLKVIEYFQARSDAGTREES